MTSKKKGRNNFLIRSGGKVARVKWEGGAYIDLHYGDALFAHDVINVWDYEADAPSIPLEMGPKRLAAVRALAFEHLHDLPIKEYREHLRTN